MTRLQIILIVLSLALVWGIFSLPKVVVDNEGGGGRAIETINEGSLADDFLGMETHSKNPDEAELAKIAENRKIVSTSADKQLVIEAAKELSVLYEQYQRFDSAAFYSNQVLVNQPDAEQIRRTAMLYFEAYSFAVDPAKAQATADKAKELLQKALDNNPDDLEAKSRLGILFVAGPQPMQGIMMLREVLEKDPENEFALYNMGLLSMESRQFARAVDYFELLKKYHPENEEGQFYLGVSYMEVGSKDKALSTLNNLKETVKDSGLRQAVNRYLESIK